MFLKQAKDLLAVKDLPDQEDILEAKDMLVVKVIKVD
jgi:hypothetical protein